MGAVGGTCEVEGEVMQNRVLEFECVNHGNA